MRVPDSALYVRQRAHSPATSTTKVTEPTLIQRTPSLCPTCSATDACSPTEAPFRRRNARLLDKSSTSTRLVEEWRGESLLARVVMGLSACLGVVMLCEGYLYFLRLFG